MLKDHSRVFTRFSSLTTNHLCNMIFFKCRTQITDLWEFIRAIIKSVVVKLFCRNVVDLKKVSMHSRHSLLWTKMSMSK